MFSLTSSNDYYLYQHPTDMRKGFDSLSGIVRNELGRNPMDGGVYIFLNKFGNLIKLLHWESGGFTLYYKRLEQGVFERPSVDGVIMLDWSDLMLIVEGIRLNSVRKKVRYQRNKAMFEVVK